MHMFVYPIYVLYRLFLSRSLPIVRTQYEFNALDCCLQINYMVLRKYLYGLKEEHEIN